MSNKQPSIAPPVYIDTQDEFEKLIEKLKHERVLAVDTEANSLYAYHEQVCLIQISTKKTDYILDPLALEDLSPLGDVFQDPSIEKIFHASEYDILILHEDFQFQFQNLFDTMLAAQILGRSKLGLDALLEELVGIKVNKKYQRANWGKRPLSDEMLSYAQIDTHYLIRIREHLAEELKKNQLIPIAEEDFTRACLAYQHINNEHTAPCWKINGARKLTPQQAAVLAQLCRYRDQTARKVDKPVFKVLSAQTLLKLAENTPSSVSQMMRLDIPSKKNLQRHAEGLLKAIQLGLETDPIRPPTKKRVDSTYLARENGLRNWRKHTAHKMKVNSAVIMPRDLLYRIVSENPRNRRELDQILEDVPWRRQQFGNEIMSVIQKANSTGRKN